MPKETVHDLIGAYDVRIGWTNDRDVQVGVETAEGHALLSRLYGDDETLAAIGRKLADSGMIPPAPTPQADHGHTWLAAQGRYVLNVIEGSASNPTGSFTGVWSTLDRAGCNRLIKAVRRARDAAFGRDE